MADNQYTFENEQYRKTYWHTCSHILAQAVKRLYPEVKLAIGPSITNGFYYDFDAPVNFTPEILTEIEAEMKKICKEKQQLERFELPRAEALALHEERTSPTRSSSSRPARGRRHLLLQAGRIHRPVRRSPSGLHRPGQGQRLQADPVLPAPTGGATNRKDAPAHLRHRLPQKGGAGRLPERQQEEARKRDHNKLGRELEFFTTVDVIGQGLPILLPKGAKVIQTLQRWVEDEEEKRGYLLTKTPYMAKRELYKISGHWDHYLDGMFVLGDPDDETKECFALRPMTCPFQYQVYPEPGPLLPRPAHATGRDLYPVPQ